MKKYLIFIFVLILSGLGGILVFGENQNLNFTWTFGKTVNQPQLNYIDGNPGMTYEASSGILWFLYTDGSNNVHILKGSGIDSLTQIYIGKENSSFNKPYGDDRYWLLGLWVDPTTGWWYSPVHIEFNYGKGGSGYFNWFRRIGLAISKDQGKTWSYVGDIVTSQLPVNSGSVYPGNYYYWGDGDMKLFVDKNDGFFYLFYMTAWVNKTTGQRIEQIRVARSPIKDKMAPGSWEKWFEGEWSQPGIAGLDSPVFFNADSAYVFYDTYLERYVAIGNQTDGQPFISTCTSLSKENWTKPENFGYPGMLEWYIWPYDQENHSMMYIGKSFRLYSSQNYYNNTDTKYIDVTFNLENK